MATSGEYADKVRSVWEQYQKQESRPETLILHSLPDEKAEPLLFFHNSGYRVSRKYINVEKVKILREQALECIRSAGNARHHKCIEVVKRFQAAVRVASNVDRGPLARKRDVGFVYHHTRLQELQKQAAELEVEFPFRKS